MAWGKLLRELQEVRTPIVGKPENQLLRITHLQCIRTSIAPSRSMTLVSKIYGKGADSTASYKNYMFPWPSVELNPDLLNFASALLILVLLKYIQITDWIANFSNS